MDHLAELDSAGAEPGRHRHGDAPRRRPALLTLPVALRSAMVRVRPSAVLGAVAVLVVVLAIVGVRTAWAQRAAEPTPVPSSQGAADVSAADPVVDPLAQDEQPSSQDSSTPSSAEDPSSPDPSMGGSADSDAAPEGAAAYVHVIGAVLEPGVVEVSSGDRVSDVVEAAGGLGQGADLSRINLARVVSDGERIWVPVDGEEPPEAVADPVSSGVSSEPQSPEGGVPGASVGGPIDINTADSSLLQTLPGVGPVTAESILAWRAEHGTFSTIEELMEVSGIGPRTLEKLRPHLVVGP